MDDVIEKSVLIDAPRERVWRSLADAAEFGAWFRCRIEGSFEEGRTLAATITMEGRAGLAFWLRPVTIDPPGLFVFDWPVGEERSDPADGGDAPTTRVTFRLEEEGRGTRVTVTESGFLSVPPEVARRKYPENVDGWTFQTGNLKAHVET